MSDKMHVVLARTYGLIYLFFLAISLLTGYALQLAETNEYMGYRVFPIDPPYLASVSVALIITSILMPTRIARPSDLFALLYGLFVLLPYATLHPIRAPIEIDDFFLYFFALAFPLLAVSIIARAIPPIRLPGLIDQKILVWLIIFFCLIGLALALSNPPPSAGFDFATSYERRMEGRGIFSVGTPLAYLNAAIVNGFAPFLAFFAGWHRKPRLLVFSILCGLAYFYLLGLKAPILFIVLAFMMGYAVRVRNVHLLAKSIFLIIFGVLAAFITEYLLFGFSLVGDYLVRRAFSVPPYLISAYFEFMNSNTVIPWSPTGGANTSEPITFVVGEWFLGFPGLNANTSAFLYQLAAGGVPMYLLTILLVAGIFAILDSTYATKRHPALLYLGFSYGILLTEQAATTALVSSGIGLLIMLTVFSKMNAGTLMHQRLQMYPNLKAQTRIA